MNKSGKSNGSQPDRPSGVMVVHSWRLVREALVALLEEHGIEVVASVGLCMDAGEACKQHKPEAVVTGTSFGDGDLNNLAGSLRRVDPTLPFLVVGEGTAEEFALALKAGASGYLGTEARGAELASAVKRVIQGTLIIAGIGEANILTPALNGNGHNGNGHSSNGNGHSSNGNGHNGNGHSSNGNGHASNGNGHNGNGGDSRLKDTTPREREILSHLTRGHSNRQIAESLFISEHTVRTHIQNIRSKLSVRSKMEAALLALQANLGTYDEQSEEAFNESNE